MSSSDYIPQTDAGRREFALNFAALITLNPSLYGLVAGDAVTIQSYVDAYDAAYQLAVDPPTRNVASIAAKDAARAAMLGTIRPYAQRITANAGVSNADKLELRLRVHKTTPTPVPIPTSTPILSVVNSKVRGQHLVRFTNTDETIGRSKPPGVTAMQLYVAVGAAAVADPTLAKIVANITRQPFAVTYTSGDNGKVATYFARWVTQRGEWGEWSGPASLTIAF